MAMIEINEGNYEAEVLGSDGPFLLDFSAVWCPPCQQLKPILEELAGELGETARIGYCDIDQSLSLASKHGVVAVPTMLLFKDGVVAERVQGLLPKKAIFGKINAQV